MCISRIIRICMLSAAVLLGHCAHAQTRSEADPSRCSDAVIDQLGKHFGLDDFAYPAAGMEPRAENGGLLVAGTCKPWPADNARIIAAFAYDAGIEYEKRLLLAVVERSTHRVIASYTGVIPEDAAMEVSGNSLRIDTARYALAKNTRAFGLRLRTFRDRCTYEGGFDDELTLFVVDGRRIRPVLTETTSHWSFADGNRCGGEDVARTDASVVVAVEHTASKGFADLRLTASRNDNRKPLSVVVKYDGERYDTQGWKKAFNAWWYR